MKIDYIQSKVRFVTVFYYSLPKMVQSSQVMSALKS